MSGNTDAGRAASATRAGLIWLFIFIELLMLVYSIGIWKPTYEAVKRIEANQQKCQEQGKRTDQN